MLDKIHTKLVVYCVHFLVQKLRKQYKMSAKHIVLFIICIALINGYSYEDYTSPKEEEKLGIDCNELVSLQGLICIFNNVICMLYKIFAKYIMVYKLYIYMVCFCDCKININKSILRILD